MFGDAVASKVSEAVRAVDLELCGFLARPLYVESQPLAAYPLVEAIMAHRLTMLRLVEGTEETVCDSIDDTVPVNEYHLRMRGAS